MTVCVVHLKICKMKEVSANLFEKDSAITPCGSGRNTMPNIDEKMKRLKDKKSKEPWALAHPLTSHMELRGLISAGCAY